MTTRIAFLGSGNMAGALAKGFAQSGLADGAAMVFRDIVRAQAERLAEALGGRVADSTSDALAEADIVLLAVKPQNATELLADVTPHVLESHLLLSIMAGVPCARIEGALRRPVRLIRVMPNTPALVGAGASALARGAHARAEDMDLALRLFASVGLALEVDESQMDAVTALSGSGPAFVFFLIEAMADAGARAGLDRRTASRLALQTAHGAARLALETGESPADLRERVTSKGGTTAAGLDVLRQGGFADLIGRCIQAAAKRAEELGREEA